MDIKGFLLAGLQKVAAHTWYSCVHRDDDDATTLADEMDTALKGFVGVSKLSGSASTYILNFKRADNSSSTAEGAKLYGFSMASQSLAGMMSAADKTKLDSLPNAGNIPNIGNVAGEISASTSATGVTITIYTPEGENLDDTNIPAATTEKAGVMTANDKAGLDTLRILLRNPQLAAWLAPRTTGITADVSYHCEPTQIDLSTLQSSEKVVGVTTATQRVYFQSANHADLGYIEFEAGVVTDLSAIITAAGTYYTINDWSAVSGALTLRIIEA